MPEPSSMGASPGCSEAEWRVRVELAAAYRLIALFGWDDLVFTHVSAKIPGTELFLINRYGWMFEEITASSLVQVDIHGRPAVGTSCEVNPAGFTIHSCIHAARPDAACIMHTHSINGVAVSAQDEGLLPLSQFALTVLASLGYHDYEGFALRDEERDTLVRDLGPHQHLMLHNHGLLTVGASIADAFLAMHRMEAACMVQVRAQNARALRLVPPEICERAESQVSRVRGEGGALLVWSGLLRRLDRVNPGYDQ